MKIYGYCRISTPKQNIERQVRNILKEYPEAIIVQETYSGTHYQGRKELEKLIRTLKFGDTIVFDSVSRMSRNAEEGFNLYEELYHRGIELVFLKEPHINTATYRKTLQGKQINMNIESGDEATDKLMLTFLDALNDYILTLANKQIQLAFLLSQKEIDDLHQRTREGIETARRNGKQIGQKRGRKLKIRKKIPIREIYRNVINRVMGTYGGTISADVLTQNCKRNPKPELADLRGVRLALASELEEGATLSTSMLKQLASTDKITAERKYKYPFTFTPSHTTVLLTNYLPEIPSGVHSKGTWRRLIVVPFNAQIELGQDVKNYADILFEQSGEAILSWIIEGAQKIINKNYHLDTPEAVLKATDVYKENNDWLQNFMNERCEIGENLTVKAGEFLAAYKDYCTYTGETNKKAGVINAALEAAGYKRQKTRSGVVIKGLRLR